jgi:hypothetical protein
MEFVLAGCYYRSSDARNFVAETKEPIQCQLVPDPTNAADSSAIKVMCNGMHIGFVPKGYTSRIGGQTCGIMNPPKDYYMRYQPVIQVGAH